MNNTPLHNNHPLLNMWGPAAFAALVAAVQLLIFHQAVFPGLGSMHGDWGDGRLVVLTLEHGYRYLTDGSLNNYWATNWNFYPLPLAGALTEPMLGNLLIYAPWRLLGFSMENSSTLWAVSCSLLNYLTFVLLMRNWRASWIGAISGAVIFAFSQVRGEQLNHLQLLPGFPTVICLLALTKVLRCRQLLQQLFWAALSGLSLSWQFYCSLHLGWFAIFGSMFCLVAAVFIIDAQSLHRTASGQLYPLFTFSIVFIIATAPLYLPISEATHAVQTARSLPLSIHGLMSTWSFVLPSPNSLLYHWLYELAKAHVDNIDERVGFCGFLALFAVGWTFASCHRQRQNFNHSMHSVVYIAAVAWIAMFLLCTKNVLGRPFWPLIYSWMPGADGIRATGRLIFAELILMSVCVSWLGTVIGTRKHGHLWSLLCLLILSVENFAPTSDAISVTENHARMQSYHADFLKACSPTPEVFFDAAAVDSAFLTMDALWHSFTQQVPTVNGYSGHVPANYHLNSTSTAKDIVHWLRFNQRTISGNRVCVIARD